MGSSEPIGHIRGKVCQRPGYRQVCGNCRNLPLPPRMIDHHFGQCAVQDLTGKWTKQTAIPAFANLQQAALPIPLAAPVTTATLQDFITSSRAMLCFPEAYNPV